MKSNSIRFCTHIVTRFALGEGLLRLPFRRRVSAVYAVFVTTLALVSPLSASVSTSSSPSVPLPSFAAPRLLSLPGSGLGSIAQGDFNSDGIPDLAIAAGTNVTVFTGKGDGTFSAGTEYAAG